MDSGRSLCREPIGLGMTVSKRAPNSCVPASLANDSFDGQEKTRVSEQKQFDTRADAQKMKKWAASDCNLWIFLEAGVGIEPAYTALQAAA
jgi:hypothetical protein